MKNNKRRSLAVRFLTRLHQASAFVQFATEDLLELIEDLTCNCANCSEQTSKEASSRLN